MFRIYLEIAIDFHLQVVYVSISVKELLACPPKIGLHEIRYSCKTNTRGSFDDCSKKTTVINGKEYFHSLNLEAVK